MIRKAKLTSYIKEKEKLEKQVFLFDAEYYAKKEKEIIKFKIKKDFYNYYILNSNNLIIFKNDKKILDLKKDSLKSSRVYLKDFFFNIKIKEFSNLKEKKIFEYEYSEDVSIKTLLEFLDK